MCTHNIHFHDDKNLSIFINICFLELSEECHKDSKIVCVS